MIMAKKRVVIWLDEAVRESVKKLAKKEGRILSSKYVELFLKGHQQEIDAE